MGAFALNINELARSLMFKTCDLITMIYWICVPRSSPTHFFSGGVIRQRVVYVLIGVVWSHSSLLRVQAVEYVLLSGKYVTGGAVFKRLMV